MTTSPKQTRNPSRESFEEDTISYSGEDLKQLLEELTAQAATEEETVEYPISPDELRELMKASGDDIQ